MEQSFIEYSLGKDASSAVLWVYPVRKPRGKAIIMCPGGGFNQIASDHEGHVLLRGLIIRASHTPY